MKVQSYSQATMIAEAYLDRLCGGEKPQCLLLHDATLEKEYGWVFFYRARDFDPDNVSTFLAGNAPFVVLKSDGSIAETGTAHRLEYYLSVIEQSI